MMLTIAEGAMYEAIHVHTLTFLHVFSEEYSVYCPKFVSLRTGGGGGGGEIGRTIT